MAETDTGLELKKRARRRLVGAAALALLAAVVLPLIMDHEPRQPNPDVQIRIPNQDAPGTRLLGPKPAEPVTPAPQPAVGTSPAPVPVIEPAPEAAKSAQAPVAAPAPVAALAAKTVEAPVAKAVDKPAAKSQDKPTEKPAEKPKSEPAKDKAATDAARAESILNGGGDGTKAEKSEKADKGYVVQVGVFTDPGRVRFLREKLKAEGMSSLTEPVHTDKGDKTKLKAGPFPNKEAANKAKEKLKRIGLDGMVVAR